MTDSTAVAGGDSLLVEHHNDLRTDIIDLSTGHRHDGTSDDGYALQFTKDKASDETVTNSTTLQNDDDFSFAVAANDEWNISLKLKVNTNASSGGFKFAASVPSGGSYVVSIKPFNGVVVAQAVDAAASITPTSNRPYIEVEYLFKNGGNAGTFQVQWAQQVADVSGDTVEEESQMIASFIHD